MRLALLALSLAACTDVASPTQEFRLVASVWLDGVDEATFAGEVVTPDERSTVTVEYAFADYYAAMAADPIAVELRRAGSVIYRGGLRAGHCNQIGAGGLDLRVETVQLPWDRDFTDEQHLCLRCELPTQTVTSCP